MKNKHSFKKLTAALLALVTVLGLAACTVVSADHLSAADPTIQATQPSTEYIQEQPKESDDPIGLDKAKKLVLTHLGVTEGSFREVDTDLDDNEYELEVTVNGVTYDFEINARTGKIKEIDREDDKSRSTASASSAESAPAAASSFITLEEAKALVLAHLGVTEGSFREVDTDLDDNEYELEVTVNGITYDFEINARTGKIKEIDREDDKSGNTASAASAESAPAAASSFITLEEAKALVLAHLGVTEGSFREVDTDLDDNEYELEVTVNGVTYDFEINARTGKIKEIDREDDHNGRPAQATSSELIGMEKAKQIVRDHLGDAGARFVDAELDDGKYEFEVISGGREYDYEVHATSGKILKAERDD